VNGWELKLPNLNLANHITLGGFGDEVGDWVVTFCGLTICEERYCLERSGAELRPDCAMCIDRFRGAAAAALHSNER
jgi:hypothetical protein